MRGDDRRADVLRQRDGGVHQRLVVRVARALHFERVTLRKAREPFGREPPRGRRVALLQSVADVAVAPARQRDQPVGPFVKPFAVDLRAAAMLMREIGARQPVAKPQVAVARGREQQDARRLVALAVVGDPHVAAGDRLDATRPRRRVELDQPELVREIGERERRHPVRRRCGDGVIDAQRAVRDREFAVQAEMDKAGRRHETPDKR